MLDLLRRLFGKARVNTNDGASVSRASSTPARPAVGRVVKNGEENGRNTVSAADTGNAHDSAFFCREALVGRDQKIVGYEFGYPRHLQPRIMEKRVKVRQYYDDSLLRQLAELELDSFLGNRLALVEISCLSLDHPALAALLRKNVALMLCFPETEAPDAQLLAGIMTTAGELRANGAYIGLEWPSHWRQETDFPPLAHVDFVQIAWSDCADKDPLAFLSGFRQIAASGSEARQAMPLRLIVRGLRTPNDFWQCYRLGVDFFRGEFINSRDQNKSSKNALNRLHVLQLLNKLRQGADTSHLEEELKQDPVLSYRLLAYANSPLLGVTSKITHLGQAVTLIGRDKLYRWLAALLFNVADPGYYDWALTEQALARAALMERLGKNASGVKPDALFLTGLFSLLDQLMEKPMDELARQIQLSEDIRIALVRREGILAQFLALAEVCERMDPQAITQNARALGLSSRTVNAAVFDALAWAHAMAGINAG